MAETQDIRSFGAVFDTIAVEYDRHRPAYPDVLVDHACGAGGLVAGDRVLEVGCGTGQLTRSLLARGLHVTAVEPGGNLIELAARGRPDPGTVRFLQDRFEDASPGLGFAAVCSAAAFHWIDPDVSWGKVAASLEPGGLLALLQYCGVRDERTATDDDALLAVLAQAAPETAAGWPELRDLDAFLSGAEDRRENVSEVWTWVGSKALARDYAADLFDEVEIAVSPGLLERSAEEINALLRTTSPYHRMSAAEQHALERGNAEIEARLGRPLRSSMMAVLVTARRSNRGL